MRKQDIANRLQSLVVSEWNSIKGGGLVKGSSEGCGVLFIDGFAYATNGHYAVRISSPTNPSGGRAFWLDIDKYFSSEDKDMDFCWGEVDEHSNPLTDGLSLGISDILTVRHSASNNPLLDYGVPLFAIKQIFALWQQNIIRVFANDLIISIKTAAREIKERRKTLMICRVTDSDLEIAYLKDNVVYHKDSIPLWLRPGESVKSTPSSYFMVNASYLYKILGIFEDVYRVVTLSFDDVDEEVISGRNQNSKVLMIKGRFKDKPDIRVAIAQIKPNPGENLNA